MKNLIPITEKESRLVIGLMSGTCTDGIDAALVQINGYGFETKVKLLSFLTVPYHAELRSALLQIASGTYGGSHVISNVNFLLGKLSAQACLDVCEQAKVSPDHIDFIGSHGHTIYHQPTPEDCFGHSVTSTLQIGEASVISEVMHCPVIADFRVRDMAAGGLGAPLVPYSEYILYSEAGKNIALQNIGGIGNITFLPSDCNIEHIMAFDTGPGNMIIDALVSAFTDNRQHYDRGGAIAASGIIHEELLSWLLTDAYLLAKPPKTTGREHYGAAFVEELIRKAATFNLSYPDIIATATIFTAKSIEQNVTSFLPQMPDRLIVGGGGSQNKTLMKNIKDSLPQCQVMINEDLGLDSNAKEAVAFALLANEYVYGINNNVITATGARHGVVMGKLTI